MLINFYRRFAPQEKCRRVFQRSYGAFCNVYAAERLFKTLLEGLMLGSQDENSLENYPGSTDDVTDLHQLTVSDLFPSRSNLFPTLKAKRLCISEKSFSALFVEIDDPNEQNVFLSGDEVAIWKIAWARNSEWNLGMKSNALKCLKNMIQTFSKKKVRTSCLGMCSTKPAQK